MRIRAKHVIKDMTLDLEYWFESNHDTSELTEEIENGGEISDLAQAWQNIQDEFSQVETDAVTMEGREGYVTFKTNHMDVTENGEYIFEIDMLEGDAQERLDRTGEFKNGLWEPNEDYDKPNPKNRGADKPNGAPYWTVHLTALGSTKMKHSDLFYVWNPKDRTKPIYPGVTADGDLVFSDEVGGEPLNYVGMTSRQDWDFDSLPKEWWTKAEPKDTSGMAYPGASTVTHQGVQASVEDEEIH